MMFSVSIVFVIALLLLLLLLFLALARHGLVALSVLTLVLLVLGGSVMGIRHARMRAVQMQAQEVEQMLKQQQLVRQRLHALDVHRSDAHRSPQPATATADSQQQGGPLPLPVVLVQPDPESASSGSLVEIDSAVAIDSLATAATPTEGGDLPESVAAMPSPATDTSSPTEAAVAPLAATEAPPVVTDGSVAPAAAATEAPTAPRPDWLLSPPQEIAGQPAQVLASDPFETGAECDVDMQRRIRSAIQDFAGLHCTGVGAPPDLNLPLHPADIRHVSRERFVDVIQTSVGPMKQVHQLIVFDESFRRVLDRRVSEAIIGQRLVRTGVFSGGVLLLVGSLFGILKGGAARRQARAVST